MNKLLEKGQQTPKEKAKELVQLFYNNQCSHSITELAYKSAKQCALICVDRELASLWSVGHSSCSDRINELLEVKKEISK